MNRTVMFVATGLCAAPLLALAGFALTQLVSRPSGGGSDQSIAQGYMGLVGGFVVAVGGFFALGFLAQRFVPEQQAAWLLLADAVLLVVGIGAWRWMLAPAPQLEYPGARAVLQVEVRLPRALLGAEGVDAALIDFAGGVGLSVPHPELARRDGDALIVPWETTPLRVSEWTVRVIVHDQPALFALPLPAVPADTPEWSGWIGPAPADDPPPAGVTLRHRFRVLPYGS